MNQINRRQFVANSALALAGAFAIPRPVKAADASIDILLNEELGTILPDFYGHFVEHLGAVVYDGIWVGEGSKIGNVGGMRKSLIDALARIKAPLIRYPGGCFADSYNWRDGVGERSKRPRRTNFWYGVNTKDVPMDSTSRFEPNEFGTNEFLQFCRLTGARPYMAANVRGLNANDFWEWVEYCNSPAGSTTLANLRASGSAGSREPFKVEFWGIGNESWGCGGEMTPEEYSQEFRKFTAAYPGYDVPLKFIGAGASSDDLNWTRGFFAKMREKGEGSFRRLHGWGVHHYSWNTSAGRTSDWNAGKGDAVDFNTEQYYEMLRQADSLEEWLLKHWAIMGEYDRAHRTKIAVDEWGTWHKPGTELKPTHLLGQQNTMRDALVASISLDIFNRHPDKVMMGNIAQLVNCLQALFLADGDRFITTPTFHVFEMFVPHMNGKAVRTIFDSPRIKWDRNGKPAEFWGLNGSASVSGKTLTLTITNPHNTLRRETEIRVRGARAVSATARVLANVDIKAHNTFERPNAVVPRDETVRTTSNSLVATLAPASVTRLTIALQ
jgi:alpha-L-arabinofuranosidase